MSGPKPMTLGPYAFEAHGFGFAGLKRTLDTSWSSIEVCGRMEALHWTGPKSEEITISGVLFPEAFGGLSSLDGVRSAAESGRVLSLITADGGVHGRFVIESVDEDRGFHDERGRPRKDAYSIKLKRASGASALGSVLGALSAIF